MPLAKNTAQLKFMFKRWFNNKVTQPNHEPNGTVKSKYEWLQEVCHKTSANLSSS